MKKWEVGGGGGGGRLRASLIYKQRLELLFVCNTNDVTSFPTSFLNVVYLSSTTPVSPSGLVVKASAPESSEHGFDSRLPRGSFSRVESHTDTGPTGPSTDLTVLDIWQGGH